MIVMFSLILFLINLAALAHCAFVLDRYSPTCEHEIQVNGENKIITVINKDWTISGQNIEIEFNVCDAVQNKICGNHKACIRNNSETDKSFKLFGDEFKLDDDRKNLLLTTTNYSQCSLSVKWDCTVSKEEEPKVNVISGCEFEVTLAPPLLSNCAGSCFTNINTLMMDLTPLKGRYSVRSNHTFVMYLCGSRPICNSTICDTPKKDDVISLSPGKDDITHHEDTNEVELRSKSQGKIYQLFLKCNWETKVSDIYFKEAQIQGKKFRFEMESSYGCVKLPPVCEFIDKYYKYNLTKAYSDVGFIEVKDVPNQKKIFINICGPLKLPQNNNVCSKSYSQVCQINHNEYINYGSMYTKPEISNGNISMSLIMGSKCHHDESKRYETKLVFRCSKTEKPPKFEQDVNCTLKLIWDTPAACPEYNIDSCNKENHMDKFSCNFIQSKDNAKRVYDLRELHKTSGYVVGDKSNKSIEYHLNICGPIIDSDAPCKKNAMVMLKYLEEVDIRKRVISFGQINQRVITKGNRLVIETSGGEFCEASMMDYKSTIFLECDYNKESEISLKHSSSCAVEFLWKTKYVCGNKIASSESCLFHLPFDDGYMLDFSSMKKTPLKTQISGSEYLFDLCGNSKSECTLENCTYVPVNTSVFIYNNKPQLEFDLNRTCDHKNLFNKTVLELACDKITENDHYEMIGLENCILSFQLKTSKICYEKELVVPLIKSADSVEYKVDPFPLEGFVNKQNNDIEESKKVTTEFSDNCTVKNMYTGFKFNIKNLNINISYSKCPDIVFNVDRQMVSLIYELPNSCTKENGERASLDFRVLLKCKNKDLRNSTQMGLCAKNITFETPIACKLLQGDIPKGKPLSTLLIAVIVVTVTVGITIAIFCGYFVYKRRKNRRCYGSLKPSGSATYDKDGDL